MAEFFGHHFNCSLSDTNKEAILKDCQALKAPKFDGLVREQLSRKSKDPQFGSKQTLYKPQEHLLEVTGLLACLGKHLEPRS